MHSYTSIALEFARLIGLLSMKRGNCLHPEHFPNHYLWACFEQFWVRFLDKDAFLSISLSNLCRDENLGHLKQVGNPYILI